MKLLIILLLLAVVLGGCVPGNNKSFAASTSCSGFLVLGSCNVTQTTQADEVAGWLSLILAIGGVVLFWVVVWLIFRKKT